MEKLDRMGGIHSILEQIFRDNGRMDILVLAQIKKVIYEVLPETVKKYIEVKKYSNGKLHLKSQHSIWSAELKFNKTMIVNKLNEKLGKDIIKDIVIK